MVKERECLRPTDVSVDGGETVPENRRHGQRPYQINMHLRETCRREVETPERGFTCIVTLDCWQGVHARGHARQSYPTPSLTNRWETNLTVALAPLWLRLWRVSKTWRLKASEWPWFLSRGVHPHQPKRRTIFQDVLQLRILILGTRKSLVIKR